VPFTSSRPGQADGEGEAAEGEEGGARRSDDEGRCTDGAERRVTLEHGRHRQEDERRRAESVRPIGLARHDPGHRPPLAPTPLWCSPSGHPLSFRRRRRPPPAPRMVGSLPPAAVDAGDVGAMPWNEFSQSAARWMAQIGPPYNAGMYSGYGHGSWLIILVPLVLLALRALSSGRRRATRRPQAPPSFFVGQPSPPGAPPSTPPANPDAGTSTGTPAGWFRDPFLQHEQRYWSGTAWTEHVLDDGVPGNDPPPSPAGDAS
jgi:Protein of unknown function (DUF2510)